MKLLLHSDYIDNDDKKTRLSLEISRVYPNKPDRVVQ